MKTIDYTTKLKKGNVVCLSLEHKGHKHTFNSHKEFQIIEILDKKITMKQIVFLENEKHSENPIVITLNDIRTQGYYLK